MKLIFITLLFFLYMGNSFSKENDDPKRIDTLKNRIKKLEEQIVNLS